MVKIELGQAKTSAFMYGFKNNLAQLFSFRSAMWNICSGRLKVKVTLEGQMIKWSKLNLYIYAWISK